MGGENVIQVTEANWKGDVIGSDLPVLVDFWAEWCGPCRAMNPTIEAIAEDLAGKLRVAKVNVDDNQQLAVEFSVRSIPTLLLIKNGEVQEQMVGAMNRTALEEKISVYL
ncbi:MAG: thioredoxin [Verrucomicrobia bacterium]|nr:thioredoxin [Verrucomicrobiota bacterium]